MRESLIDLQNPLDAVRQESAGHSIAEVLSEHPPELLCAALDGLVADAQDRCSPSFGYVLPSVLASRMQVSGIGDFADSLVRYCRSRLGEWPLSMPFLFEALILIFPPPDSSVRVGRNLAAQLNELTFDKDGLLVGPKDKLAFTKEGVLIAGDWYLYDRVLGAFVTGSFADDLIREYSLLGTDAATLGMRINRHIVISSRLHFDSFTKAYIRGPKGLSADLLNQADFPPDPSGTVTEHRRTDSNPILGLSPLDRIEVMWSRRKGYKSVQIEALPPESQLTPMECRTSYVHSTWSPQESCIVHFDGALKTYDANSYVSRFRTDIKKSKLKPQGYEKVFRLEGHLELGTWCTLAAKYFDPNELIIEYMGGADHEAET